VLEQPASTLWLLATNLAVYPDRGIDQQLGIDLLRRAIRRYPRDFWLNYEAGVLLMNIEPDESLAYLHAAHSLRPQLYAAHHNLAMAWGSAGFPDQGIAQFNNILRHKPDFWWPQYGIAHAYLKRSDYEQALMHFQRAIECNPPSSRIPSILEGMAPAYYHLKQPDKVIAAAQHDIRDRLQQDGEAGKENGPLGRSFGLLLEASTFAKLKASNIAKLDASNIVKLDASTIVLPFLREMADEYPRSPATRHYLALALAGKFISWAPRYLRVHNSRDAQRMREARAHIEAACELAPKNRTYRHTLPLIRKWMEEPAGEVALWQDAVAANPESTAARIQLAWACIRTERWQEALDQLRTAREVQPGNPDVLLPLCNLLVDCPDTALRNPKEGLQVALQCRTHRFGNNDRLFALAHFRLGNWKETEQFMKPFGYDHVTMAPIVESIVQSGPDAEYIESQLAYYYVLAIAKWKLHKKDEAVDWFLKAALPEVLTGSYRRYGRRFHREAVAVIPPEAIIAECTRRLEKGNDPRNDPSLYFARGEARARLAYNDEAAADFAEALELLKPETGWPARQRIVYQRLAEFPDVVERVAKLRPDDHDVWIEVGRHHAMIERWKPAAAAYGKVVDKENVLSALVSRPRPRHGRLPGKDRFSEPLRTGQDLRRPVRDEPGRFRQTIGETIFRFSDS
jgi:tetratricopeptide (TPR) repeat protein